MCGPGSAMRVAVLVRLAAVVPDREGDGPGAPLLVLATCKIGHTIMSPNSQPMFSKFNAMY